MPPSLSVGASALQAHLAAQLSLGGGGHAPKPTHPSLAQRLGLLPGPPPPLSPEGWVEVQQQCRLRQDSQGHCTICLRPFKAESQVLLSCSHTFHQQCLASFERYAQQRRCCPLCRCQAYQKRRIDDGEQAWRHACATRIQAAWRGAAARRHARQLRRLLPPTHPVLRRRWCAERVGESTDRLVASVQQGASNVDALFAEMDAAAAAAGAVFRALAARCPAVAAAAPAGAAGTDAAAAGEGAPTGTAAAAAAAAAGRSAAPPSPPLQGTSGSGASTSHCPTACPAVPAHQPDWEAVLSSCLQRATEDGEPECSICLAPLSQLCGTGMEEPGAAAGPAKAQGKTGALQDSGSRRQGGSPAQGTGCRARQRQGTSGGSGGSRDNSGGNSGLAVLSCTHAFHADCLSAFEAFAIASELAPKCPCCRAAYTHLDLS